MSDKHGFMGKSSFPYQSWDWIDIGFRLGGPNFISIPEMKMIIGTRIYSENGRNVGLLSPDSTGDFELIMEFPSSGDTGYPGMVIDHNMLLVSYYSSHEGKASIYLAKIPLNIINRLVDRNSRFPFY